MWQVPSGSGTLGSEGWLECEIGAIYHCSDIQKGQTGSVAIFGSLGHGIMCAQLLLGNYRAIQLQGSSCSILA